MRTFGMVSVSIVPELSAASVAVAVEKEARDRSMRREGTPPVPDRKSTARNMRSKCGAAVLKLFHNVRVFDLGPGLSFISMRAVAGVLEATEEE